MVKKPTPAKLTLAKVKSVELLCDPNLHDGQTRKDNKPFKFYSASVKVDFEFPQPIEGVAEFSEYYNYRIFDNDGKPSVDWGSTSFFSRLQRILRKYGGYGEKDAVSVQTLFGQLMDKEVHVVSEPSHKPDGTPTTKLVVEQIKI